MLCEICLSPITLSLRPELALCQAVISLATQKECSMDKDRIKGSANQAKGAIKDAAGKITGDAKLQAEGKADKLKGKIQNAAGGIKDSIRENKD